MHSHAVHQIGAKPITVDNLANVQNDRRHIGSMAFTVDVRQRHGQGDDPKGRLIREQTFTS